MQTLNGFVKIHRKLVQWGWYQDNAVKGVFLHLLLTASFRECEWLGKTIKKGQLVTSYGRLAQDLGFSIQQVRTALNKLKSTGEITCESTSRYTVITVEKWEDYQIITNEAADTPTQTLTNGQQTSNKPSTNKQQHRKNVKNNKNVKKKDNTSPPKLPDGISSVEEWKRIQAERRR